MPTPSFPTRRPTSILAPALAFGAIQAFAGAALGLPAQFDARGLAFAMVLAVVGLLLSGVRPSAVKSRRESVSVAAWLRAVAFLFAPALAFPGFTATMLALVAFLFWWLALSAPQESTVPSPHTSVPSLGTRAKLLHDLGLTSPSPSPRRDSLSPRSRAFFSFRAARQCGLVDATGLVALALALGCVPFILTVVLTFQGASRPASWLVFFLVSVASWEHVFRASVGADPNDTRKESIA